MVGYFRTHTGVRGHLPGGIRGSKPLVPGPRRPESARAGSTTLGLPRNRCLPPPRMVPASGHAEVDVG
eukprot:5405644-Alexandrium_andersonii.AAC.1